MELKTFNLHINFWVAMTALVLISLFSFFAVFVMPVEYIVAIDISIVITSLFIIYPMVGLYLIAGLFPFWGLALNWQQFNIPYVDFIGAFLFLALVIKTLIVLINKKTGESIPENEIYLRRWPVVSFWIIFMVATALSMWNNPDFLSAAKYWLRPLAFFYLVYVLLPVNLITNAKTFRRVLYTIVGSSLVAGFLGFLSVLLNSGSWFAHRALPYPILGYNLLGGNHNAMAEIMIVALPILLILYLMADKVKEKKFLVVSAIFLLSILVLTFSRSGWLALFMESLLFFIYQYKDKFNIYKIISGVVLVGVVLGLFYLIIWGQVAEVQGSTSSRWLMTSIAWNSFLNHPILGNGLNSFNAIIGGTFVYWVEYGDPLDSHGVIQKLMTENGLFGLISFGLMLLAIGYELVATFLDNRKSADKTVLYCLIVLCAGVVFFQLFSTSYYIVKMWLPIGIAIAGTRIIKK